MERYSVRRAKIYASLHIAILLTITAGYFICRDASEQLGAERTLVQAGPVR